MTKQQTRWLIACAAVVVGILLFIVAKWLLIVLVIGLVIGGVVFATESAKAQTAPARPPTPVYHPPMPTSAAGQPASYAQGYQAQSTPAPATPGFPFGPARASEPQPHKDRPGEIQQQYEEPLTQYPES